MNHDYKRNNGRGLYIALAICMLAILCIGVGSAVWNVFTAPQVPTPMPGNSTVKAPAASTKAPVVTRVPAPSLPPVTQQIQVSVSGPDDLTVSVVDPSKRTFSKPVAGSVLKDFSQDVLVYSVTMNDYRVHSGVDIAASLGNPVNAFCDGTVSKIYEDPLMGHTVVLDHGAGLTSVYQNLGAVLPQDIVVGAKVSSGQTIAGVGESALIECAESPHLHFEVHKDGVPVDPTEYIALS